MFTHKKIVMITPARLGDTLMCTPAIHYLKYYYPSARISIIALSLLSAQTLENNPDIDQVLALPSQKSLKQFQYDIAVNIHDGPLARQYLRALNIPVYHIPAGNPHLHQAEQALLFMQSILPKHPPIRERKYRLFPLPNDDKIIQKLLINPADTIFIGCQIGCHSIAKKRFGFLKSYFKKMSHPKIWPFDAIVELARKIHDFNPKIKIIITGSKSEKNLGRQIVRLAPNMINLIDKTTPQQLYALMKYLKAFITPDTGVMHAACSADAPLIALFGHTSYKRTGPYPEMELSRLTLIQAPSMADITAEKVLEAVKQKISG